MSGQLAVVHPVTGELLTSLDQLSGTAVAELRVAIDERQRNLKAMLATVDEDIRRRLKLLDRKRAIFGEFEIEIKSERRSVWDAPEAETVLEQLVKDGTLRAGEVTEAVTHETVAHAGELTRVLAKLDGPAQGLLAACRSWASKGPAKVTVVRSQPLIAETSSSAPTTPAAKEDTGGPPPASSPDGEPAPPPITHEELFA